MFGFFSWLRSKAKEAILEGITDAADEVENSQNPPFDAEAWRRKFAQKALPPSPESETEPDASTAKPAKREKGGR